MNYCIYFLYRWLDTTLKCTPHTAAAAAAAATSSRRGAGTSMYESYDAVRSKKPPCESEAAPGNPEMARTDNND